MLCCLRLVEQEYEKLKIGELIGQLRQDPHMTQQELAKRLGTTKSAISRLEKHADSIRLETLERVVKVFDNKTCRRHGRPPAAAAGPLPQNVQSHSSRLV
jgi:DNA-binding XRE family transcriptional regulator